MYIQVNGRVPVASMLTRCPATPSKMTMPILLETLVVNVLVSPKLIRTAKMTSLVLLTLVPPSVSGGTNKSPLLTAVPDCVLTEIRPDCPDPVGTFRAIFESIAVFANAKVLLSFMMFDAAVMPKLLPEIFSVLPGSAIEGLKPIMTGVPGAETMVKGMPLFADPEGVVTVISPVVAPAGTVVVICVLLADSTVAPTPLKDTVFCAGTGLKPVP
jgi:hypothetical protein